MINKITRRGFTQEIVHKNSHSRVLLSGIPTLGNPREADPQLQSSEMTKCVACKGFTLIELLVVVLIIGILGAIALPQYTLAVNKSRFATYRSLADEIAQAARLYYLSTGEWPASWNELDVEIPAEMTQGTCAGGVSAYTDQIYCCLQQPKKDAYFGSIFCGDQKDWTLRYQNLFADSNGAQSTQYLCAAKPDKQAVCLSLDGKFYITQGSRNYYRLPGSDAY